MFDYAVFFFRVCFLFFFLESNEIPTRLAGNYDDQRARTQSELTGIMIRHRSLYISETFPLCFFFFFLFIDKVNMSVIVRKENNAKV